MLIIIGETNTTGLFGKIFPETEFVRASENAQINAKNAVVIAKNGNARVLSALGVIVGENAECNFSRGVQLIACGNSSKNTISITSRTSDKITLALNRAIRTKTGICEPLELPVELDNGFSEFDYMAGFAASLMLK